MNRRTFLLSTIPIVAAAPIAAAQFTARSLLHDPEKDRHIETAREMYGTPSGAIITAETWHNIGRAIEYLLEMER